MEQLTQNLKTGEMRILEVPFPAINSGCVLVRNHFSLISAGTEEKTVRDARLNYFAKARARKDEVKKVLQSVKAIGLSSTWKMVMNRLDAPVSLGYSSAGQVIAVADDVRDFQVGDFVACGGAGAVHAEVVCVPVNLCTKVDESVPLQHAAFTTLGSIAMQGVRQADLRLGENCVVIGLGLIGQLTVQLLRAAGIKTVGIDINPAMTSLAQQHGCDLAMLRKNEDLEYNINQFTGGHGADAVIITASSDSTDPVDLAGILCRRKGKVIIVGNVPTGFKRNNFYKKELDLRMSSSYGPGRYDSEYEEQGIDYPYAYVRWTENRNMQSFVSLLHDKKIVLDKLLTHTFQFEDAANAYQMILDKSEPYVGIVLKYDSQKELKKTIRLKDNTTSPAGPTVGFIGAGSFAQNILLPAIKGLAQFVGVATARPNNARNMADKYGFSYCTGDASEIFSDSSINTVFVATRHDSHAEYVVKAMKSGKNVFSEKPLCLHPHELEEISKLYSTSGTRVMVGFNRRFAPLVKKIKSTFTGDVPVAINYRINAGVIPADHWIHNPQVGGGRIVGELCHFIDLCMFIAGSPLVSLSSQKMKDAGNLNDTLSVILNFQNGSIATVSYFSNGNKNVSKEFLEIFGAGMIARLDDFSSLEISGRKTVKYKSPHDKGHAEEVRVWLEAIRDGKPSPVPFEDIYLSTKATFKVMESIALNGGSVSML